MTLKQALQKIVIEDKNHFVEDDFIDDIAAKLPGWAIEVWDCDEQSTSLTACVVDYIKDEVLEGRTDIQYAEWCTDSCDAYFCVVATKKPGRKK